MKLLENVAFFLSCHVDSKLLINYEFSQTWISLISPHCNSSCCFKLHALKDKLRAVKVKPLILLNVTFVFYLKSNCVQPHAIWFMQLMIE